MKLNSASDEKMKIKDYLNSQKKSAPKFYTDSRVNVYQIANNVLNSKILCKLVDF